MKAVDIDKFLGIPQGTSPIRLTILSLGGVQLGLEGVVAVGGEVVRQLHHREHCSLKATDRNGARQPLPAYLVHCSPVRPLCPVTVMIQGKSQAGRCREVIGYVSDSPHIIGGLKPPSMTQSIYPPPHPDKYSHY
jgi:hypothetical protein